MIKTYTEVFSFVSSHCSFVMTVLGKNSYLTSDKTGLFVGHGVSDNYSPDTLSNWTRESPFSFPFSLFSHKIKFQTHKSNLTTSPQHYNEALTHVFLYDATVAGYWHDRYGHCWHLPWHCRCCSRRYHLRSNLHGCHCQRRA